MTQTQTQAQTAPQVQVQTTPQVQVQTTPQVPATQGRAQDTFETLSAVNVNGHTEKKNGLTYLSWAWAWAEVRKRCPDATYEIVKGYYGLPYVFDPQAGYMVFTKVTIAGETHEMWLPVMDGANRTMTDHPYQVQGKYGKPITVAAATMFDINKAIMRCLTKNLAMFGLGLYIYAGEDLPETEQVMPAEPTPQTAQPVPAPAQQAQYNGYAGYNNGGYYGQAYRGVTTYDGD